MLNMSVANARLAGSLFDLNQPPSIPGSAENAHTLPLHQLPPQAQDAVQQMRAEDQAPEWDEAAIVQLHWVLLCELKRLADPETPLEEMIDTLDWALAGSANDQAPFSFASCVRVVGTSPLSPTAFFGLVDVDELRGWIYVNARRWLRETIARYPRWAQDLFFSDPHYAAERLCANPQWFNEQIRRREAAMCSAAAQPDLFGLAGNCTQDRPGVKCAAN